MKIDDRITLSTTNAQQAEKASTSRVANKQDENVNIRQNDRVELSTRKSEMDKLLKTAADMPDIRAGKVAELKQKIDDGSYKVDGVKVAEKMLKQFTGSEE